MSRCLFAPGWWRGGVLGEGGSELRAERVKGVQTGQALRSNREARA
jgi:hypothetical protein